MECVSNFNLPPLLLLTPMLTFDSTTSRGVTAELTKLDSTCCGVKLVVGDSVVLFFKEYVVLGNIVFMEVEKTGVTL